MASRKRRINIDEVPLATPSTRKVRVVAERRPNRGGEQEEQKEQQEERKTDAVTPGLNHTTTTTAASANTTTSSARRSLFSPSDDRRAVATITPSKDTPIKTPDAKRKLIFGRPVEEINVKSSVKQVYGIIKKLTGSIGGNSSFGPIYGELTMGSMQKMVNLMKEHTNLNQDSCFIDIGSGIGKPNLHVAQDPGVQFSYGIEVEESRWLLGLNCLKYVFDAAIEQQQSTSSNNNIPEDQKIIHGNCMMDHGDIRTAKTFAPFTHVYAFSIGFPPSLWCDLSEIWNKCTTSKYLICYHGPKDIMKNYGFNVELVVQTPTSMHGSKEGHTGYIYRRTGIDHKDIDTKDDNKKRDPLFDTAYLQVTGGLAHMEVNRKVNEKMNNQNKTRSRVRQR